MLTGFALVLAAAALQGSFVLPMTLTRKWKWENTWLVFSALGPSDAMAGNAGLATLAAAIVAIAVSQAL